MKYFYVFTLLSILLLNTSCGNVDKAFSNQKKKSNDEFLVEKKSPLVMPPNYNELPIPKMDEKDEDQNNNNIQSLITKNKIDTNNDSNKVGQNFEESILKKIKKN